MSQADCELGKVRLRINNSTENTWGRVEYCVHADSEGTDTEWRSVCDQIWGEKEAILVCRELGFGGQLIYYIPAELTCYRMVLQLQSQHWILVEAVVIKCSLTVMMMMTALMNVEYGQ